ncbi:unnamed protein product [Sphenostylis stenocarpa]|uniref:Uncharacterized protein n=1 Tax=Sphenostylis stenocarpa TaxID=92480 RepID=A0AA86SK71_9FABA|nr:unnamed protein product [Sphenostylis stenocarpa]
MTDTHDPHNSKMSNTSLEGKTAQKQQYKRKHHRPRGAHAKPDNPRSKQGTEDSPATKRKVKKWRKMV